MKCFKCKEEKSEKDFYKQGKTYCKKCFAIIRKEWLKTPKGIASLERAKDRKREKYKKDKEYRSKVLADSKRHQAENIDAARAYARKYSADYRINNREKCERYARDRRKKKMEAEIERVREWAIINPDKLAEMKECSENINIQDRRYKKRARKMLNDKIYDGKIVRSEKCSSCGSSHKIHAHHTDYSRPFDVVWLCEQCHLEAHRILRAINAAFPSD